MKYCYLQLCYLIFFTIITLPHQSTSNDSCNGKQDLEWVTPSTHPYSGYLFLLVGEWWKADCRVKDKNHTINVTLLRKPLYRRSPRLQVGREKLDDTEIKNVWKMWLSSADSGRYYCSACGVHKYIGGLLVTNGAPAFAEPSVSTIPNNNAFEFGSRVTLECSLKDKHEYYEMGWFKLDTAGKKKRLTSPSSSTFAGEEQRQVLVFPKLGLKDEGTYLCEIRRYTVSYTGRVNITLRLRGMVYPNIQDFPEQQISMQEHVKRLLPYNVSGWPKPNITWYRSKNGTEEKIAWFSPDSNMSYSLIPGITNNAFSIENPTYERDHNATYTCDVSNVLGTVSQKIVVTIKRIPEIKAPSDNNMRIQIYKIDMILHCALTRPFNVTFEWHVCQSNLYPLWGVSKHCSEWKHVKKQVGLNSELKVLEQNYTFVRYRCHARNEVGKDEYNWIIVKPGQSNPAVVSRYLLNGNDGRNRILQIAVIALGCLVLIILVMNVRNKRKEKRRHEEVVTKLTTTKGASV